METAAKSIKSAAKEAKKRLKSRFWEDYKKELENGVKKAESEGVAASGVENYFKKRIVRSVRKDNAEDEKFYEEVKAMLDEEGSRPSDALDRLMDKKEFYSLKYEDRERYLFILSEKITDLTCSHADITGRHVNIRSDMSLKLGHESLTETHYLSVAFSVRIKVGAAFCAAHRKACKRVFKNLLKTKEAYDRRVY